MKRSDRIYAHQFAQDKGHLFLVTEARSIQSDRKPVSIKRKPKPSFDTSAALKFLKS